MAYCLARATIVLVDGFRISGEYGFRVLDDRGDRLPGACWLYHLWFGRTGRWLGKDGGRFKSATGYCEQYK